MRRGLIDVNGVSAPLPTSEPYRSLWCASAVDPFDLVSCVWAGKGQEVVGFGFY